MRRSFSSHFIVAHLTFLSYGQRMCKIFFFLVLEFIISLLPHMWSVLMYVGCVHEKCIFWVCWIYNSIFLLRNAYIVYITFIFFICRFYRGVFISCGFISFFLNFLNLFLFYVIWSDVILSTGNIYFFVQRLDLQFEFFFTCYV